MKPSQNKDVLEGGCTRCGGKFYLPLDEDGNPIWTHTCPKTIDEKIDELNQLVRELKEENNESRRS